MSPLNPTLPINLTPLWHKVGWRRHHTSKSKVERCKKFNYARSYTIMRFATQLFGNIITLDWNWSACMHPHLPPSLIVSNKDATQSSPTSCIQLLLRPSLNARTSRVGVSTYPVPLLHIVAPSTNPPTPWTLVLKDDEHLKTIPFFVRNGENLHRRAAFLPCPCPSPAAATTAFCTVPLVHRIS